MTGMLNDLTLWIGKRIFRFRLSEFYEELLENLKMNIGVSHFLQIRRDLAVKRGRLSEASVYKLMLKRLEQGGALSAAGQGILPHANLIMIQAGEHVAKIIEGVETAWMANRSMSMMRAAVIKHLISPVVLTLALAGLMLLFGISVIPQFLFVVPVEKLGGAYRLTYGMVQLFTTYWWLVLPAAAGLVAGMVWSIFHLTGPVRHGLDRLPPYSLVRHYTSAALLINISGLLRSNVTLREAVDLLMRDATPYEKHHLAIMKRRLNGGYSLPSALDTGLIPDDIIDRLMSFEQAGSDKLEQIVRRIGFENIDKSLRAVESKVQAAAGSIRVVVGAMLGWLVYDTFTLGQVVNAMVHAGGG